MWCLRSVKSEREKLSEIEREIDRQTERREIERYIYIYIYRERELEREPLYEVNFLFFYFL